MQTLQKKFMVVLGWFFLLLSAIGVLLPILPTTPFLILALAIFANNSPKFHQMLLNNRWFGPILKDWEDSKTVTRHIKVRATLLVIVSFSLSVFLLQGSWILQTMLISIAVILLVFIWRLREKHN